MKLINRIRNNKLLYFLGVLIIGLLIILIVRITYAYLGASINEAKGNITLNSDDVDELKFDIGDPLSINATPTTLPENGENLVSSSTSSASLLANSTNDTAEYGYYVYFKISNNTFIYSDGSTPEIILTVKQGENEITNIEGLTYGTFSGVSGFDITTASGLFNVASSYSITSNSSTDATVQEWTFTITYLNLGFDQSANFGNSMTTEVMLQKNEVKPTLADYIINNIYTTDGENGIYYHDGVGSYTNADQEAGDNSYRYSGANPNNYVCFGSDADTCPDEYLYRIIGVFDEDSDGEYNVKLIKADYTTSAMLGTNGRDYYGNYDNVISDYKGSMDTSTIAGYKWNYDTSVSSLGSNNWTTSELNKTNLNNIYLNYLKSSWNSMIEDATWYLGGMTSYSNTAKSFYTGERNNTGYGSNLTTYGPTNANGNSTKIGLMYVSDYGYAAYPDAWKTSLSSYNSTTIVQNNWLYMGLIEWTMTPHSSASYYVCYLNNNGNLSCNGAYYGYSVRPVLYLKSNILYVGGNGTKASPFRIAA